MSRRTLDAALASRLRYVRPPQLVEETREEGPLRAAGSTTPVGVRAVLGDDGAGSAFEVTLRIGDGGTTLSGECSRCSQTFGPCVHVTVLAVDLAVDPAMRAGLLDGSGTAATAEGAPSLRVLVEADVRFDGALAAWLAPAAEGVPVEIAAGAFAEVDPTIGRGYGDRRDEAPARLLTVTVRRAGERKLLSAREIVQTTTERVPLGPRDRRALQYTRDRGSGKKAVHALGVDASLTLEAMREHGQVFAEGFKDRLDFRGATVRPTVVLTPAGATSPGLEALAASWTAEDDPAPIAFADSVFFPGPFPFVWTRSGAIYRVARDVDLNLAAQLARSPVLLLPGGKLREAGARLLRAARGRGVVLPTHETFGLPRIETPRLVLRLAGEPLDVTGELLATYPEREVPLYPDDGVGSEDGRDVEAEARARAHVEKAGLARHADQAALVVSDEEAIAFWRDGLPRLRAATDPAIDIQLTDRLARVRVGAPIAGRVHVTLEGNWLAARLEYSSGELPVELDAVRQALWRRKRWVTLRDGTLARISSTIEALTGEVEAVLPEGEGRLPAHQLGRLDRWIEENDGHVDAAVEGLRGRLRALAVAAEPDMPQGLRGVLRPYQRTGLAWLQFLQALGAGGILADDMGLGKTITTLAFLLRRKESEGPAASLVVCPTSVATNWVREAARFTPDLRITLHHGPSRGRDVLPVEQTDVIVTTYALLRRDLDALARVRFRCVVLDEAQNIKNAESATTRAARELDASMRLALSGTPVENRLGELWSLASFCNPGILGTARAFETRFERPIASDPRSPLGAELRAIVRPFLLRRTKDDVLRELPPKTEIDRVVTLGRADKRMYDALAHSLRASLAKDLEKRQGLATLSVFTALTRLRQMACDPRLVDPRLENGTGSAKREAFLELVRELCAEGRRALVFSQFVQLLTLWRRDLDREQIAYEYLDGSTVRRDEAVTRFQEGKAPLFLISLKAGGAGLNLTAADTVIHCDPWWNPAVEDQATDRAYRIGQDKPVTVVRLVARGTIEEKILSLKARKREIARAVIGDDARALEGLTEEDVRLLLGDAGREDGEEDDEDDEARSPEDVLATADAVMSPEFDALAVELKWWMATTGRKATDVSAMTDVPVPFVMRLAEGKPFPCSRAVAERIRGRLRSF